MKPLKILLISSFLLMAFSLSAQQWLTDFEEAKKVADAEQKTIILVFQGSDWCAPCIKLDHEIWQSEVFQAYAEEHFVLLKADFPRKKKNALNAAQTSANKALAKTYNPNGYFPFVVILNPSGEVLGRTGYKKTTPEKYINHLVAFIPKK